MDALLRGVLLLILLSLVNSQGTESIPTADLSPNIGTNNYRLQCNIDNFQPAVNRALVWTKDGKVISWDQVIQPMFLDQFNAQDSVFGGTIYYTLTILQVGPTHGGVYKCLIADGRPTSYTEVASSAQVNVIIPYFPPAEYPMCSPSGSTVAVAGNPLLLSCTSLPGYPDEVNILLQRGSTILSSSRQTVNNMKRIDYYITPTLADNGALFKCIITGTGQYTGMDPQFCEIGPLEVVPGLPRITPSMLTKSVGEDAMFMCTLSAAGTIQLYTEPPTPSGRYTTSAISEGMSFTLINVQLDDNMRVVVCKATVEGKDVFDRATLNVISIIPQPTTKATTMKPATTPISTTPMVTQKITNPPVVVPDPTTQKPQPTMKTQSPSIALTSDMHSTMMSTTDPSLNETQSSTLTIPLIATVILLVICFIIIAGLVFKICRSKNEGTVKDPMNDQNVEMKNQSYECHISDVQGPKDHTYECKIKVPETEKQNSSVQNLNMDISHEYPCSQPNINKIDSEYETLPAKSAYTDDKEQNYSVNQSEHKYMDLNRDGVANEGYTSLEI